MDKALGELIRISNIVGKDSLLVQGGGGNTSVKTDDGQYMYIKASDTALKDMNAKIGWRRLRLEPVLSIIKDNDLAGQIASIREPEVVKRLLYACQDKLNSDARPSVESHLHAMLEKYVIHLHPLVVGSFVNAANGKTQIVKLFSKETFPPLWIPYADPGFMLAKKISTLVEKYQKQYGIKPAIMFLEKHGLFVTANSADAGLKLVRKVIDICSSKLKKQKPHKFNKPNKQEITEAADSVRKAVAEVTGKDLQTEYFLNDTVTVFMQNKDARKMLAKPTLNPDELIYAGGQAMWLDNYDCKTITRKLKARIKAGYRPATSFVIKGLGLFICAEKKMIPVISQITTGSLFVRMQASKFGGIRTLSKRQRDFIDNWESEAFRLKLAAKT